MAEVEPMDVESDFEDKENSLQLNNVLTRASFTEKGYEELDVSEISMKLRYSITPCGSPMSKSYSGSCRGSKCCDTVEASEAFNNGNSLTQSLNSTLTNLDNKVNKLTPLQPLAADILGDMNRNPLSRRSLDLSPVDPNITITLNDNDHIDSLSLPSTSSSNTHTPEVTTPTKEIPKDGGSPIMRGLKSVFSMFRSSQSPIPLHESTIQSNDLTDSPSGALSNPLSTVSTPISAHKNKETSPKRNSPLKDSIVFNDDLEKELLWKDETTIIFKDEKIPISKLLFHQSHSNHSEIKQNVCVEKEVADVSVEYMDISHNESATCDKTMTDVEPKLALNVTEIISNNESDGEFVDCETTFTKCDLETSQQKRDDFEHSQVGNVNEQMNDYKNSELHQNVNILEIGQTIELMTEQIQNVQVTEGDVKYSQFDKNEIKNSQEMLEAPNIIHKINEQITNNQESKERNVENSTEISEVQAVKQELHNDTIYDNNSSSVVNTTEVCANTVLNQGKESNFVNETSKVEDCIAQSPSSVCKDKSMCLLNNCDTSDIAIANTTKEIEQHNTLPSDKIVDVTNTSLLQNIPDEINKTINLVVNNNETVASINENSISEFKQLKENVSSELISNINTNMTTVTSDSVHELISCDKMTLQSDTNQSVDTTKLDDIIKDVHLYDANDPIEILKSQPQMEDAIDTCDEKQLRLMTGEISDPTIYNETGVKNSSVISYSSNQNATILTDVLLPSCDELEQDLKIDKGTLIKKVSNDDLKLNIFDYKLASIDTKCGDLHETFISNINLDLPKNILSKECNIKDLSPNNLNTSVSKFNNIDLSYVQSNVQPINTILDKTKEQDYSVYDGTRLISPEENMTVSLDNTVDPYENPTPLHESMKNQGNSEYQIISSNFIPDLDIKMQDIDEIITSASNSPYVSVTDLSLTGHDEVDVEKLNNSFQINQITKSPPISPKAIKKDNYDFNFDDIEDPFATKTRIRLSPTPEIRFKSLPINNTFKKNCTEKKCDGIKSKQKSQQTKITKVRKNLSSNLNCSPKDKKDEKPKNNESFQISLQEENKDSLETKMYNDTKSDFFQTNTSKIEASDKHCFNPTYDSVVSDNDNENFKNQQKFDENISGGDVTDIKTNIHNEKTPVNNVEILTVDSNFNGTIDCDPKAKEHKLLLENTYKDYLPENVTDIITACQSDKNATIDLIKDIETQKLDVKTFHINTLKDTQDELEANVTVDEKPKETNVSIVQSQANNTIPTTNNHKTLTTDECSNIKTDCIIENETAVIEEGKSDVVTDVKGTNLLFENNHIVNEFEQDPTVSHTEKLYSMTELGVNHTISEEKEDKKENVETKLFDLKQPMLNMEAKDIKENNETFIGSIDTERQSIQNKTEDRKTPFSNINVSTSSSKNTNDNTVREILTEDEDTIEGSFFETDEYSNQINVEELHATDKMTHFNLPPPLTNIESADSDELFIDAEAFEFLLNQNKSNIIADSGKESLFLKFDPLFAKRLSSDGILTALNNIQRRQSTPKKVPSGARNIQTESPQPGPSKLDTLTDETVDHLEMPSIAKPMMVVNPAVNPIPSPRKVTPKLNRRSLTFTSPAIAVIDRLLSLNGNNSLIDQNISSISQVGREYTETDIALTQLRELLAEKEIHVHNLRCESKDLKDRLANLETQMKNLETESGEKLRKINILNERLTEKTKINKSMALVVEEYERTIASLISDLEHDKKRNAEERMKLTRERDEQTAHLASMEVSFNDLHSKYEKSKQIILSMKANEDKYKNSLKDFEDSLAKMHSNYEFLKQHATSKLNHANQELEKINKAHESEVLKLNALIKRKELHITSLEETLAQKTKANEELTAICDELINKVG